MAWESMERDGYESDKSRLFIMDVATGEKTYYTKDFDQNAGGLSWSADGKSIFLRNSLINALCILIGSNGIFSPYD